MGVNANRSRRNEEIANRELSIVADTGLPD
jgi:hypothetical protein